VVDGARDATQEGIAAASVAGKASARPELETAKTRRSGLFAAQIYIEAHFAGRISLL
jgi:hypothetical protein